MNTVWIICDEGKKGTLNQCLGLARALNCSPLLVHDITPTSWEKYLPVFLRYIGYRLGLPTPLHHENLPPPHLIIGGGRRSASLCAFLKKKYKCPVIFLQSPYLSPSYFDWVIAPFHDRLKEENVIEILGCIHNLPPLTHTPLNKPCLMVSLGGDTLHYRYEFSFVDYLVQHIHLWAEKKHGIVFITPSRRTRPDIIDYMKKQLPFAIIWDGTDPNPYHEWLQNADQLIVTGDSISMACDACFTGKPVYIAELPKTKKKWQVFHQQLYKESYACPLEDLNKITQENPSVKILNERQRVADILKGKLNLN